MLSTRKGHQGQVSGPQIPLGSPFTRSPGPLLETMMEHLGQKFIPFHIILSSQPRHGYYWRNFRTQFIRSCTIYPCIYIYSPCTIYSTQTHPRTSHPGLLLAPLGKPMSSMHSRKMHICITLFDLMCSTFSFKNEKICLPNCTQICPLEGSSDKNFYHLISYLVSGGFPNAA